MHQGHDQPFSAMLFRASRHSTSITWCASLARVRVSSRSWAVRVALASEHQGRALAARPRNRAAFPPCRGARPRYRAVRPRSLTVHTLAPGSTHSVALEPYAPTLPRLPGSCDDLIPSRQDPESGPVGGPVEIAVLVLRTQDPEWSCRNCDPGSQDPVLDPQTGSRTIPDHGLRPRTSGHFCPCASDLCSLFRNKNFWIPFGETFPRIFGCYSVDLERFKSTSSDFLSF